MKINLRSFIRSLASLKLTVVCLAWLFVITFMGTLDQVQNGLYAAQHKYFTSFFFSVAEYVWLPGAKLTMMVLFINLLAASRRLLQFRWSKSGILCIHVGLLLFFVAAYATYVLAVESQITMVEGESTNTVQSLTQWELAIWRQDSENTRSVVAYDMNESQIGKQLEFKKWGVFVTVKDYMPHSMPMINRNDEKNERVFHALPQTKNPTENKPTALLSVEDANKKVHDITLFGPDSGGVKLSNREGEALLIQLRRTRRVLPFTLTLKDFRAEFHPKTQIAKSFESDVLIEEGESARPVRISMNKPLRVKDYTVYQASYGDDSFGRETSTFAVVKNPTRLLPYIASILVSFGLFLHVLILTLSRRFAAGRSA